MRGTTLIELVTVLVVLGALLSIALPPFGVIRDRWAVAAAREAVVALYHEARGLAVQNGSARLVVEADSSLVRLQSWGVRREESLTEAGVTVAIGGGRPRATAIYGPSGTARFAAATLRFSRGEAESELVVSGYGRVRRR